MPSLRDLIPDPAIAVGMHPADLAGVMLEVLMTQTTSDRQLWHRRNFCGAAGRIYVEHGQGSLGDVMQACSEAWSWLESNGLICRDPEQDNDWFVPTRRAREVRDRAGVRMLIANAELPQHFLHPEIADHARPLFLQGRLDTAVFEAFKTLEVEIRSAARLGEDLIGVKLASRAFDPQDGPLADTFDEEGERVALRNLMAGAIGSYKNPASHRRVDLNASEAREMLMLASHLLKIVDSRKGPRAVFLADNIKIVGPGAK
jgi:uncharacterized protein (TIGR02391 family)